MAVSYCSSAPSSAVFWKPVTLDHPRGHQAGQRIDQRRQAEAEDMWSGVCARSLRSWGDSAREQHFFRLRLRYSIESIAKSNHVDYVLRSLAERGEGHLQNNWEMSKVVKSTSLCGPFDTPLYVSPQAPLSALATLNLAIQGFQASFRSVCRAPH